jgi:hypothetical protein
MILINTMNILLPGLTAWQQANIQEEVSLFAGTMQTKSTLNSQY